jgi:hypothetical protein
VLHLPPAYTWYRVSPSFPYMNSVLTSSMYCSGECRLQDQGEKAKQQKAHPVHLTAQLHPSLSPHFRPHTAIQPSPRMPPHVRPSSTSSESDESTSPLNSPNTIPAGAESPHKDPLDLGPPAFPNSHSHIGFPGSSVPVKIPAVMPRPAPAPIPAPVPSHGTYGTSIDTLRFGRKPALINSVTSPNALIARCACGKPANHPLRATSKERGESEFSLLSLGPSRTSHRVVSDTPGSSHSIDRRAVSGYASPTLEPLQLADGVGASALSRSRSDPMHPKLAYTRATPTESTFAESSAAPRRKSHAAQTDRPGVATLGSRETGEGRGRSRDRIRHAVEAQQGGLSGMLTQPPEREPAPSRSRHRRDEAERERERQRSRRPQRQSPALAPVDAALIVPSWSRAIGADDGIAPSPLRGGWRSPNKVAGRG